MPRLLGAGHNKSRTAVRNLSSLASELMRTSLLTLSMLLQEGPMMPDLSVDVVSDRIELFQARLGTLMLRYERQATSERLFGLPVTEYPELDEIRHELDLLRLLYDLYNDVTRTIRGYFDIRWHDINIDRISRELRDFQTRFY